MRTCEEGEPIGTSPCVRTLPHLFEQCLEFQRANGVDTIDLRQSALGDTDGSATLFEPQEDHDFGAPSANTLVSDSWQARKAHKTHTIKITRLDTILEGRPLRQPVTIKIDVEDYEAAVLRGAKRTIEEYRPMIICEILPRQHGNGETIAALDELRYAAYAITAAGCFRFLPTDFAAPRVFKQNSHSPIFWPVTVS